MQELRTSKTRTKTILISQKEKVKETAHLLMEKESTFIKYYPKR